MTLTEPHLKIDTTLWRKLKAKLALEGKSLSQWFREVVKKEVEK